jgi:hypothetical protein
MNISKADIKIFKKLMLEIVGLDNTMNRVGPVVNSDFIAGYNFCKSEIREDIKNIK